LEHLKFETGRVDDKGEETNVQELGACLIRVRVLRVCLPEQYSNN
jgi:hypothetical protein